MKKRPFRFAGAIVGGLLLTTTAEAFDPPWAHFQFHPTNEVMIDSQLVIDGITMPSSGNLYPGYMR